MEQKLETSLEEVGLLHTECEEIKNHSQDQIERLKQQLDEASMELQVKERELKNAYQQESNQYVKRGSTFHIRDTPPAAAYSSPQDRFERKATMPGTGGGKLYSRNNKMATSSECLKEPSASTRSSEVKPKGNFTDRKTSFDPFFEDSRFDTLKRVAEEEKSRKVTEMSPRNEETPVKNRSLGSREGNTTIDEELIAKLEEVKDELECLSPNPNEENEISSAEKKSDRLSIINSVNTFSQNVNSPPTSNQQKGEEECPFGRAPVSSNEQIRKSLKGPQIPANLYIKEFEHEYNKENIPNEAIDIEALLKLDVNQNPILESSHYSLNMISNLIGDIDSMLYKLDKKREKVSMAEDDFDYFIDKRVSSGMSHQSRKVSVLY